jgi:AraC-like DNA-binding protein
MNLFTLTIIYFIAYNSLRQKEIFPLDENQREEIITISQEDESTKPKRKLVSEDELISLKALLTDIMQQQKPYLDCDINLMKLSELLNITPHQLSYVINTGFNENFFQYINRHRIEKAKELLLKEDTNNLSILGIAFESGFRSKTSFNTTFKKITNQTPSEFKKSSSNL